MIDLTTCPPPVEARDLLTEFAHTGRQEPFEEIVRRYGGMVFTVCYDVTQNRHDAEDATQAAFLSLAVQARSGQTIHALGPWLQQVARRMSLDINRSRKRRKNREDRHGNSWQEKHGTVDADGSGNGFGQAPESAAGWDELRGIIRQELQQLPPKYRAPLLLHYYGGLSRDEMARELGCRPNTLGVRLHRARQMLGKRLAKRGITLSAVVVGVLTSEIVRQVVSQRLIESTAQAAAMMSAGHPFAAGLVSAQIVHLARGAGQALAVAKFKLAAAVALLAGGAIATGAEVAVHTGYLDLPRVQQINERIRSLFRWTAPTVERFVETPASVQQPAVAQAPARTEPADPPRAPLMPATVWRRTATPWNPEPIRMPASAVTTTGSGGAWWPGRTSVPVAPVANAEANSADRPRRQSTAAEAVATQAPLPPAVAKDFSSSGGPIIASSGHSSGGSAREGSGSTPMASSRRLATRRPLGDKLLIETHAVRPMPLAQPLSMQWAPNVVDAMRNSATGATAGITTSVAPPTALTADTVAGATSQGGVVQDGVLQITTAPSAAAESFDRVIGWGAGPAMYQVAGGSVANPQVVVGGAGTGVVEQHAGRHVVESLLLATTSTGRGLYRLGGGELDVMRAPADSEAMHGIVVGASGEGVLMMGTAEAAGVVRETGDGTGASVTVGSSMLARGTLRGWGAVELSGTLTNNGQVIADGMGQDRVLDLSTFATVTRDYRNRDVRGWYARSGGRLELPAIRTQRGTGSYTWGDRDDSPLSYVNSVRLTLTDAPDDGRLRLSLASTDRTDLPAFPDGHHLLSAWTVLATTTDGRALTAAGGVDILVRYDDDLARQFGLPEEILKIWTFENGQWLRHDFDPSFLRDPARHTLSVHVDGLDFSYLAVSAPEPAALGFLCAAAGILLMQRRRK